jgi:CRP/FNR family cyclic AMP-dependent transcriptional regulator
MARTPVLEQFRKVSLLSQSSDETLCFIADHSSIRRSTRQNQILSFRDESNDVFFILEGRVQVKNYSALGREFIFSEIGAGALFGEFSAIDGLPRSASVVAMEDSLTARMKAGDFLELLRMDFDLTHRLLRVLTGKSRDLTDRLFEVIALNARDRVCFELARLAGHGERSGARIVIKPAPSHYELAARIGSHREAVTRELNHLATAGYVTLARRQIVIADMGRFSRELLASPI